MGDWREGSVKPKDLFIGIRRRTGESCLLCGRMEEEVLIWPGQTSWTYAFQSTSLFIEDPPPVISATPV